ncbi:MAG: peptidoglycan binding domain-containing protein, partial [Anaerolineales bacterium]|nr:peptidoglycan binding domain-containing protein [Anaerolineales bacterium]
MQATAPQPTNSPFNRNLGYFLAAPLTTLVLGVVIFAFVVAGYQSKHNGRIYTGVSVAGIDLSELEMTEAETLLATAFADANSQPITFTDPATGQTWTQTPAELGMRIDPAATAAVAFAVGRDGNPITQLQAAYQSWYYGRSIPPVLVLDEGQLVNSLNTLAGEVNQPPVNAQVQLNGETAVYTPGQNGRLLDTTDLQQRLLQPMKALQPVSIELLVHDIPPAINDAPDVSDNIQYTIGSPVTFYLAEPLDEFDLDPVTLTAEQIANWLRVDVVETATGQLSHRSFVDEVALRQWLESYADAIYREPVNARFYFDDNTRELVLVAPHVNGRTLDIDATIEQLKAQIDTPNRSVPFVVDEIVPIVNENATAAELGITELITETTTWFYGSTDARKHNIARSAANFFGIVIAPGEEFSFNKYLGSISEGDGYEQGFIIINGQTVEGIGGGVCQVSTTIYQTAFLSGFPITERWPHGYMLGYY